jgi:hypothetical protein
MAKALALALLLGLMAAPAVLAADPTSNKIEKQKIMNNDKFPDARPPLPEFRKLSSAVSSSCVRQGTTIRLKVVHAEIPDVSGARLHACIIAAGREGLRRRPQQPPRMRRGLGLECASRAFRPPR